MTIKLILLIINLYKRSRKWQTGKRFYYYFDYFMNMIMIIITSALFPRCRRFKIRSIICGKTEEREALLTENRNIEVNCFRENSLFS